jgi:hypothetical protein
MLDQAANRDGTDMASCRNGLREGKADIDRRRRVTPGTAVQTDSAVSPSGSGRSWPPVIRTR